MIESPVISVENLVKKFGDFTAVNEISFEIYRGEIFGFLGANGAGKSTTIKILCGIMKPTSGKVVVLGTDVISNPEKVKKQIGYMSQKFSLYHDLTVDENISFFGGIYGIPYKKLSVRKKEILSLVGLEERKKELVLNLPRGMQQRLAFGCALLHEPQILFLDEPTAGVDPVQRRIFWNIIYDLASKGMTFLVTTHLLDEAEYCNRICLISKGKVVANDTPDGLKNLLKEIAILNIECKPARKAFQIIHDMPWVIDASIFGEEIHIACDEKGMEENLDKLKSIFGKNQINILKIEKIEPTLEDVFLHLERKNS